MSQSADVTELLVAAAKGDQQAWDGLVNRFMPLVLSVIRRYRLAGKDAEDVSQTVWLRLVEHLDSIRVVTAGYHMPRALLELRRALPEVALLPHPMLPATLRDAGAAGRLRTWSLLLREYLKYLAVWAGFSGPAALPLDTRS